MIHRIYSTNPSTMRSTDPLLTKHSGHINLGMLLHTLILRGMCLASNDKREESSVRELLREIGLRIVGYEVRVDAEVLLVQTYPLTPDAERWSRELYKLHPCRNT